jgi:hypothetical protein
VNDGVGEDGGFEVVGVDVDVGDSFAGGSDTMALASALTKAAVTTATAQSGRRR